MRYGQKLALLASMIFLAAAPVAQARNGGDEPRQQTFRLFAKPKQEAQTRAPEAESLRAELKEAVAEVSAKPKRGRIWCVPFARAVTGIELRGNAVTWWKQAAARYERGNTPKVGAVMNFRATRKMPMGHVAVVSKVVDDRTVLVDQANWERNRITQDTLVVDISAKNDWSKVRVENAHGTLGAPYPVYGFIYR